MRSRMSQRLERRMRQISPALSCMPPPAPPAGPPGPIIGPPEPIIGTPAGRVIRIGVVWGNVVMTASYFLDFTFNDLNPALRAGAKRGVVRGRLLGRRCAASLGH